MIDSQSTRSCAQVVCGDKLVDATPEVLREVAESAMLLSQGARRAIEMMREADESLGKSAASELDAPQAA